MTDRTSTGAGFYARSPAEVVARALYAYAGRTGHVLGHRALRRCAGLLPGRLVAQITGALCRNFGRQSGPQPTTRELQRLAFLYGVFPRDPNLIALTFRVNVYPDTNAHAIEHLLARIPPGADSRDDLTILRLFYAHKTAPAGFDPDQFQALDVAKIRHDGVLADIWRVLFIKFVMEKMEFCAHLNKSNVRIYAEIERDPNILYAILYIIFDRLNRQNDVASLADILGAAEFGDSAEGFAITYFFLVSFGFEAQAAALDTAHARPPNADRHPLYIKGKFAPRSIAAVSEDSVRGARVDPAYADLTWAWRDAELQKAEIRARLASGPPAPSSVAGPTRPHLLVAVFGQMRFPGETVPGVRDWILEDFAAAGDIDITFAVSTWRETGGKVFLPDDHIDTIGGFLSPSILDLLKSLGCCTISDVRPYCPRVVSKIVDQRQVAVEVEEQAIARFFPGETVFEIGSEAGYMAGLGRTIAAEFGSNTMLMNQGRMISRIGAVSRLLETVDASTTPPTHVLFVRPDLCDLSGSLADVFRQMRDRSHWAVVDEDAYAQVVEGVGDRFILADRSAARQIAGIESYTKRIFDGAAPEKSLRRKRLEPHQMLGSLLFEAGVDVVTVPRRRVGWNLFRGAVNRETVLAELRIDVADMADMARKAAFAARL
ncbi:MAG: hypothetical protein INR70_32885 [Parafilimonas terrae]|jgi:hypothetical protein|nr:hypothetical protein [Parafilimonas terrae]